MKNLQQYRNNITSQYGEDGLIKEIFTRIGLRENPTCLEFGAWDGKYLSNVWNLWHNESWSALLIEGEKDRAAALKDSIKDFNKVQVYNAFVTATGKESLDEICLRHSIRYDLDLLSIDIDSEDYFILEGLNQLKPRVIIVEYNPTVPPDIEMIQEPGEYFGASALSLLKLGQKKGYKLAAITDTNLFLVSNDDFSKLCIDEQQLSEVFPGTHLTYVMSGYNGRTFLNRKPPYLYEIDNMNVFLRQVVTFKTLLKRLLGKSLDPSPRKYPSVRSEFHQINVRLFQED